MPVRRSLNGREGEPSSSNVANENKHGKVKAKSRQGPSRTTGEMVEGESEMGNMLAKKQAQLEAVVDKHDNLVRPYCQQFSPIQHSYK